MQVKRLFTTYMVVVNLFHGSIWDIFLCTELLDCIVFVVRSNPVHKRSILSFYILRWGKHYYCEYLYPGHVWFISQRGAYYFWDKYFVLCFSVKIIVHISDVYCSIKCNFAQRCNSFITHKWCFIYKQISLIS